MSGNLTSMHVAVATVGAAMLVSACSARTPTPANYPPAVEAAIRFVADAEGVAEQDVVVVSYEAAEWPDSCLGLAQPDEMCLQVITPGWRVLLRVGDQDMEARTDADGQVVRVKS